MSYILTENLRQSSIDWLMLAVFAALVFLLLFDLLAMLSFNWTLQKTALATERANLSKSAFLSNMSHEIRIKQIIMNLLSNAVKYTEKGGMRLSFRMEGAGDNFVMIGVSVADTGIGIMPEDMSRLFTEFERLNSQKIRGIEGAGLGLAITHRMLSLMGSTLEAESAYGVGARFFFTLREAVTSWEAIVEFSPTMPPRRVKKAVPRLPRRTPEF